MARVRTHYDNLKVSRDAPAEVIQAAYKSLAAKYHPDVNPGAQSARVMGIINRSYAVISDPERRAEHDRWIAEAEERHSTQRSFRDSIPRFQTADIERRFAKWFVPAAIGLLIALFIGALVLVVHRSASQPKSSEVHAPIAPTPPVVPSDLPKVQQPEVQVLQATPIPEPRIYKAVPRAQLPVRSEIDEVIQSGKYSQLPAAEVVSQSDGSGPPQMSVVNNTVYSLTVTFYGSTERSVKVTAGQSFELELTPGTYRILGRTSNPLVLPFVGNENYSAGTIYKRTFYVESQIVP